MWPAIWNVPQQQRRMRSPSFWSGRTSIHGWAFAHVGKITDGLVEMQSAIDDSIRIMGQVAMPHFVSMLAEVMMLNGDFAPALDAIERALIANETSRDLYFNAELHRLAAECHLKFDEHDAAEAELQQAIQTAHAQGAKTFELRAATALGRLWANRHEKTKAHALLQASLEALGADAEETLDIRCARVCLTEWATS